MPDISTQRLQRSRARKRADLSATVSPLVSLRSATSALLARQDYASRAGLSFGGSRDIYKVSGYPRTLTLQDYREQYERGDIAETIIEAYPKATWDGEIRIEQVKESEKGDNIPSPFDLAVESLFKSLDLQSTIEKADILCGLGEYSVIYLGVNDGKKPSEPLDSKITSLDQILYITPVAEENARIKTWVTGAVNLSNKRYGLPEIYEINLDNHNPNNSMSVDVHWTRVIHIADGTLESDLFGKPRLRAIWNRLQDLEKIVSGGAEASWKRADPGMHVNVPLTDEKGNPISFTADEEEQLEEEMLDYIHNVSRIVRTRGNTNIDLLNSAVFNFGPNAKSILELISGTARIPVRILVGSERGELASTQDEDNWDDRVGERRRHFGNATIRKVVDWFTLNGLLDRVEYKVVWPESEELSEASKADVTYKLAYANSLQAKAEGKPIMTADEIREKIWKQDPLEWVPLDKPLADNPIPEISDNLLDLPLN